MAYYFTREEAEALLPQISVILREIQDGRRLMLQTQEELYDLRLQAAGNGHHLHERIMKTQKDLAVQAQTLRTLANELATFGCELNDPNNELLDFLTM